MKSELYLYTTLSQSISFGPLKETYPEQKISWLLDWLRTVCLPYPLSHKHNGLKVSNRLWLTILKSKHLPSLFQSHFDSQIVKQVQYFSKIPVPFTPQQINYSAWFNQPITYQRQHLGTIFVQASSESCSSKKCFLIVFTEDIESVRPSP